MKVGILGRGRLGRSLEVLLTRAGHTVSMAGRGELPEGDVWLLTVPDDALAALCPTLPAAPILLHCSGATDLSVFAGRARSGSLHPLMTFPGPEVSLPDLRGVPAAVAGDEPAAQVATQLAADLGLDPVPVPGDRRLYHASAVLAGNFATVLLDLGAEVLAAAGVPRDRAAGVLLPLALESLRNAAPSPARALTGPVARGDHAVIAGHLDALDAHHLDNAARAYRVLLERALALRDSD